MELMVLAISNRPIVVLGELELAIAQVVKQNQIRTKFDEHDHSFVVMVEALTVVCLHSQVKIAQLLTSQKFISSFPFY